MLTLPHRILDFSKTRPLWMQDALRRIAERGKIVDADIRDLTAMIEREHGLTTAGSNVAPEPISAEHFRPAANPAEPVILLGLCDTRNVNRLASGQTLRFATDGLTIIYGDNGSGKSGYARILKKLCRVRQDGQEDILPDCFAAAPNAPAQATVRYKVGNDPEKNPIWVDHTPPPSELRRFSVFDSKAAPLYSDRAGKIEFLPYGLDLLPKLGDACMTIANQFDAQIRSLEAQCKTSLPTIEIGTAAAAVVARLAVTTTLESLPSEAEIRSAASWTKENSTRLEAVQKELARDHSTLATLVERAADAAKTVREAIESLIAEVGDQAIASIRELRNSAHAARATASVAADAAFKSEPLPGVGTDPWRKMFDHARDYIAQASSGIAFEAITAGAPCPLCQQVLDHDAADRLRRFDEFVRGKAESEARKLEAAVRERRDRLSKLALADPRESTKSLGSFDGADEEIRMAAQTVLESLRSRIAALKRILDAPASAIEIAPLPADVRPRLEGAEKVYRERAVALRSSGEDPEIPKQRERERAELLARQQLNKMLAAVIARRADLERLLRLKECRRAAKATTSISNLSTSLRREFLTKSLQDRVDEERERLGIDHLKVKIRDYTERGESYVEVGVDSLHEVANDQILSEGERKALALACFFAELGGIDDHSGIILDDPVSSLDHLHRKRVAERIVAEARGERQVIVFTHDLVFFHELRTAAASSSPQVKVTPHEIRRTVVHGCGTVLSEEEPWASKKTDKRLVALDQALADLRRVSDRNSDEYRTGVKAIYSDLREAWERMVEVDLLNEVVCRFQTQVKTQSLREVEVTDTDYQAVHAAMTRVSEYSGHDRNMAWQTVLPSPDEIERDVRGLREFSKRIKGRRSQLGSERKALEQAPPGTLA